MPTNTNTLDSLDVTNPFDAELLVLAARSDGSIEDAICEWAYSPERYPTLAARVRSGAASIDAVAFEAAHARQIADRRVRVAAAYEARVAALAGAVMVAVPA